MGRIFDEIFIEIIKLFQIGEEDNLIVKKEITKGYSGAEVYLVELKGESNYKGNYFLKIDLENKEYQNIEKGYCFGNTVAKIVKYHKIQDYYVMLMQIAGKSLIEFKAFYELENVIERKAAVEKIFSDVLEKEVNNRSYVCEATSASCLFKDHLGQKLSEEGALKKYLDTCLLYTSPSPRD